MTKLRMDELASSVGTSEIEVVKSQVPLDDSPELFGGLFGLNLGWKSYYSHLRIVQVQSIGDKVKVVLIDGIDSPVKRGIREIYEQGVNWVNWIRQCQEKAADQGHPVTGYHCINYVARGESYLGQSWPEACQKLFHAGWMTE
ncbi:MAG: hypothetical protein ACFBSC_00655 [Microcoleaceae cyanobacterium]